MVTSKNRGGPGKRPRPRKNQGRTAAGPIVDLPVDGLASGGDGVGRVEGRVVFVPLAAPGDIAAVEITSDRGSFCRGRIVRLIEKSSRRADPPCTLFGTCGGCQWQHLRYEEQLAAKGTLLEEAMRRVGKIAPPAAVDAVPSPLTYGYRHRCRLHVKRRGSRISFGFFRTGSHDVVPLDTCPVLHEPLNRLLPALGHTLRKHADTFRSLTSITMASDFTGTGCRVAFHTPAGRPAGGAPFEKELVALAKETGIELFFPGATEKPLALGPRDDDIVSTEGAFTQVNLRQNRILVQQVLTLAGHVKGTRVLDLYCGAGNFSLPLAAGGATVLGVDSSGPSIRCARANAGRLGLESALFRRGEAAAAAVSLSGAGRTFDLVVLNPPRTGARETVAELAALNPSRIVMVSCDPATFARDAALLRRGGYRLQALRALDLFPQTFHVETAALFTLD